MVVIISRKRYNLMLKRLAVADEAAVNADAKILKLEKEIADVKAINKQYEMNSKSRSVFSEYINGEVKSDGKR